MPAALVDLAGAVGRHADGRIHLSRLSDGAARARSSSAAGELGDLRLIHGGYLQDWLADETDYNWRLEPALGGASRAVADIGSHWFDTAEFVSGRRVDAVFADLATFMPIRQRPAGRGGHRLRDRRPARPRR